jgi:hypothetical protein
MAGMSPRLNLLDRLLIRGATSELQLGLAEDISDVVRTDLEHDLQDLATISSLPDFRRLMQAACLRLGQLLNQTELGRDVALPQPTVHRWLNLLETSYLLVRLSAYAVIEGPDPLLISAAKPGAGAGAIPNRRGGRTAPRHRLRMGATSTHRIGYQRSGWIMPAAAP